MNASINSAHEISAAPSVAPECREVSLPGQLRRHGPHGRDVQPVTDLERPMPVRRPPVARHPDSVAVDTRACVPPRVESRGRRAQRPQRQVRRQDGIQPSPQLRPSDPLAAIAASEAEGRDLAGGMHPGIGSPGESDRCPLAGQSVKRLLQHPLHRPQLRLVLGAGEVGPVVLDHRPCTSSFNRWHRSVFHCPPGWSGLN